MTAFTPLRWMEQFQNAGGGFVTDGETTRFCWVKGRPEEDTTEAERLYDEIAADPFRLAAVRAILLGTAAKEMQS